MPSVTLDPRPCLLVEERRVSRQMKKNWLCRRSLGSPKRAHEVVAALYGGSWGVELSGIELLAGAAVPVGLRAAGSGHEPSIHRWKHGMPVS